jgi:hypothetical protein
MESAADTIKRIFGDSQRSLGAEMSETTSRYERLRNAISLSLLRLGSSRLPIKKAA